MLVDKYISGKELEVDAICDGKDVFIPGIMEHVERTGIHSGDSISVYPTFSVDESVKQTIIDYTIRLGLGIGIIGLYNIQFIVDKNNAVYVIEVNPRSSRTVPFLSKATGYSMADIATHVILGRSLKEQGYDTVYPKEKERWYVKVPAFSFSKLDDLDAYLSPEMKSTGEAIGYDKKLTRAMYKALLASGMHVVNYGTIFVTIADKDKEEALPADPAVLPAGLQYRGLRKAPLTSFAAMESKRALRKSSAPAARRFWTPFVRGMSITSSARGISTLLLRKRMGIRSGRCAVENSVTMFTALDTVKILLDVLEETTMCVSTIDAE